MDFRAEENTFRLPLKNTLAESIPKRNTSKIYIFINRTLSNVLMCFFHTCFGRHIQTTYSVV